MIFIINGSGGSGKDTFVELAKNNFKNIKIFNLSTVDLVKDAAKILNWNGKKDETSRLFLHELKMLSSKYNDGPFRYITNSVKNIFKKKASGKIKNFMIFIHSREPEEISRFKNYFQDQCKTLLIIRDNISNFNNYADQNVKNYNYDIIIENNESLDQLELKMKKIINKYVN